MPKSIERSAEKRPLILLNIIFCDFRLIIEHQQLKALEIAKIANVPLYLRGEIGVDYRLLHKKTEGFAAIFLVFMAEQLENTANSKKKPLCKRHVELKLVL